MVWNIAERAATEVKKKINQIKEKSSIRPKQMAHMHVALRAEALLPYLRAYLRR